MLKMELFTFKLNKYLNILLKMAYTVEGKCNEQYHNLQEHVVEWKRVCTCKHSLGIN